MKIQINLSSFYETFHWLWQHPYVPIILWYMLAILMIRTLFPIKKEKYEKAIKNEDMPYELPLVTAWLFSPIVIPIYILGRMVTRIK